MDWILDHAVGVAQFAAIAVSVLSFALFLRTELAALRSDVNQMMESLKQLNTILTQIAVQDARINMMEKNIDELRHGQGFIK